MPQIFVCLDGTRATCNSGSIIAEYAQYLDATEVKIQAGKLVARKNPSEAWQPYQGNAEKIVIYAPGPGAKAHKDYPTPGSVNPVSAESKRQILKKYPSTFSQSFFGAGYPTLNSTVRGLLYGDGLQDNSQQIVTIITEILAESTNTDEVKHFDIVMLGWSRGCVGALHISKKLMEMQNELRPAMKSRVTRFRSTINSLFDLLGKLVNAIIPGLYKSRRAQNIELSEYSEKITSKSAEKKDSEKQAQQAELEKSEPWQNLNYHLRLIDPCNGPDSGNYTVMLANGEDLTDIDLQTIVTHAASCKALLFKDDQRKGIFDPIDLPAANIFPFHGTHNAAKGSKKNTDGKFAEKEETKLIRKFLADEITGLGGSFRKDNGTTAAMQARGYFMGDKETILTYAKTQLVPTLNDIAEFWEAATKFRIVPESKRDFLSQLSSFTALYHYFVNDHHDKLFKKTYPDTYCYLSRTSISSINISKLTRLFQDEKVDEYSQHFIMSRHVDKCQIFSHARTIALNQLMHELSSVFRVNLIVSDDIISIDRHILRLWQEIYDKHQAANIHPKKLSEALYQKQATAKYLGIIEISNDLCAFFALVKKTVSENNYALLTNIETQAGELYDQHGKKHIKLADFLKLVINMTRKIVKEKSQHTKNLSDTTNDVNSSGTVTKVHQTIHHPLGPGNLTTFFFTSTLRQNTIQEEIIDHPLAPDLTAGGE